MYSRRGPVDWWHICWCLANGDARLRPWEIRKLTFPEIALLLDEHGDKPTPPPGKPIGSREEHLAEIERRRRMTPMEKFEELLADGQ